MKFKKFISPIQFSRNFFITSLILYLIAQLMPNLSDEKIFLINTDIKFGFEMHKLTFHLLFSPLFLMAINNFLYPTIIFLNLQNIYYPRLLNIPIFICAIYSSAMGLAMSFYQIEFLAHPFWTLSTLIYSFGLFYRIFLKRVEYNRDK